MTLVMKFELIKIYNEAEKKLLEEQNQARWAQEIEDLPPEKIMGYEQSAEFDRKSRINLAEMQRRAEL